MILYFEKSIKISNVCLFDLYSVIWGNLMSRKTPLINLELLAHTVMILTKHFYVSFPVMAKPNIE